MSKILMIAVASLAILGAAYCLLCVVAAVLYLGRRGRVRKVPGSLPPVSVLKPLKGTDPEMYASLRSHCVQDVPKYEILFGVSDSADPASDIVKRLQTEFPNLPIQLVHCGKHLGSNGKVSTLAQLALVAKYDILLVNDSDIRVDPTYVRTTVAELQQSGVSLVTCLYRGVPARTFGSKLESLNISTDFVPGVLVASLLENGIHFGLGSTLALRNSDLKIIGGFEAMTDFLADDYELGRRLAESSGKVELSSTVVETFLPAYDFSGFITHQLRWMRTIRASRPGGYAGLPFTFTLLWALLTVIFAGGAIWAWSLFIVAGVLRIATTIIVGSVVLHDRFVLRLLWLLPLRDLVAPLLWAAGLFGNEIVWRGTVFRLDRGKLIPSR